MVEQIIITGTSLTYDEEIWIYFKSEALGAICSVRPNPARALIWVVLP